MDASVPTDGGITAPPSFTVIAPVEGTLLTEARVEVRGTATNLGEIRIQGTSVPVVDGAFVHSVALEGEGAHEIVVSAPDAGEQRIGVKVDLYPPVLEILSPPRGAFFDRADGNTIRVEGRVTDSGSSIARLRVNGTDVLLLDQRFTIDLPAHHGVNLIDVVAFDEAGRSADVQRGAIWGEYAPWDELLPGAVSVGLRADAFDAFELGLERGLATALSTAAIANQNPELTIDAIAFSSIDVELVPRTGFIDAAVIIEDLVIDFTLDTVILGSPVNTSGVMAADRIEVTSEIHIGIGASGSVESYTEDSTAALTGFAVTAQNVPAWITNTLAAILEPQIERGFVQAIDAQDLSALFDLSQFLPPQLGAEITGMSVEPAGMRIVADAAILLDPDPATPPAPGVLVNRGRIRDDIPSSHTIRTSLSADLLNGALFHTWRSGALTASIAPEQGPGEIALDAATFALFVGDELFDYADPTTPVALRLRPLLPPVATMIEDDVLLLEAADVLIDFTLEPEGEDPIRFATFAASLKAITKITVEREAVKTETISQFGIDLAEAPLFPIDETGLEDLISGLLLTAQIANPIATGTIPLPAEGLTNLAIELRAEDLTILGDL